MQCIRSLGWVRQGTPNSEDLCVMAFGMIEDPQVVATLHCGEWRTQTQATISKTFKPAFPDSKTDDSRWFVHKWWYVVTIQVDNHI